MRNLRIPMMLFLPLASTLLLIGLLYGAQQFISAPQPSVPYSTQKTYIASLSGQPTTAAAILSIESGSNIGFRILKICHSSSGATAAAPITVTVQRRTTASSGGTQLTNEGTGTTAITAPDPVDANYTGIARLGGTPGTAGAVIDQFSYIIPVVTAGSLPLICKSYGEVGDKAPYVAAGVANGLSINVSAAGAGGLGAGSITATVVRE